MSVAGARDPGVPLRVPADQPAVRGAVVPRRRGSEREDSEQADTDDQQHRRDGAARGPTEHPGAAAPEVRRAWRRWVEATTQRPQHLSRSPVERGLGHGGVDRHGQLKDQAADEQTGDQVREPVPVEGQRRDHHGQRQQGDGRPHEPHRGPADTPVAPQEVGRQTVDEHDVGGVPRRVGHPAHEEVRVRCLGLAPPEHDLEDEHEQVECEHREHRHPGRPPRLTPAAAEPGRDRQHRQAHGALADPVQDVQHGQPRGRWRSEVEVGVQRDQRPHRQQREADEDEEQEPGQRHTRGDLGGPAVVPRLGRAASRAHSPASRRAHPRVTSGGRRSHGFPQI